MKHILIILISFLLLSTPLFGDNHKGETLYRWGECCDWVWKGFGDKEIQPKYQGDVENGKPNGLGILIDPDGIKYVGEWRNGDMWNGTSYYKNGNIIGKFVNGEWIKQ